MAQIVNKLDAIESYFQVGNKIILFDPPTGGWTADTDLSDFKNPIDLGNIEEGSFAEEGEDASTEDWKAMDGSVATATVTEGSNGFSFNHMSFTSTRIIKLMHGTALTTSDAEFIAAGNKITGFGKRSVITAPIAILDVEFNKWMLYPKAKIVTSLTASGNKMVMKSTAKAEDIETAKLLPVMYIEGALKTTTP